MAREFPCIVGVLFLTAACGSSNSPAGFDDAAATDDGGMAGTGGTAKGTGGAPGSGGSAKGTGGTRASTGGSTGSGGGASAGGQTGSGGEKAPMTGTVTGQLDSSWMQLQSPDTGVLAGTNFIPTAASDCPDDPDMASGVVLFADSQPGANDALSFDWTHNYGGWHVANIAASGWEALVLPTGANAKLNYWIKGEEGGEEAAFTVVINWKDGTAATALWPPDVPGPVITSWTKMSIPLAKFGDVSNASGVGNIGTGNSHAAMHAKYYIDNIYFSAE